jgi:hypothetical protein
MPALAGLPILERAKLTPLKLKNSSCCAGLKQFQFFRSASLNTLSKMFKKLHAVIFQNELSEILRPRIPNILNF